LFPKIIQHSQSLSKLNITSKIYRVKAELDTLEKKTEAKYSGKHRIPLISARKKQNLSPLARKLKQKKIPGSILASPLTSARGFPNLMPYDYVNIIDKNILHSRSDLSNPN